MHITTPAIHLFASVNNEHTHLPSLSVYPETNGIVKLNTRFTIVDKYSDSKRDPHQFPQAGFCIVEAAQCGKDSENRYLSHI